MSFYGRSTIKSLFYKLKFGNNNEIVPSQTNDSTLKFIGDNWLSWTSENDTDNTNSGGYKIKVQHKSPPSNDEAGGNSIIKGTNGDTYYHPRKVDSKGHITNASDNTINLIDEVKLDTILATKWSNVRIFGLNDTIPEGINYNNIYFIYKGTTSTQLEDGAQINSIKINGQSQSVTPDSGWIVLYNNLPYFYDGEKWHDFDTSTSLSQSE